MMRFVWSYVYTYNDTQYARSYRDARGDPRDYAAKEIRALPGEGPARIIRCVDCVHRYRVRGGAYLLHMH